VCAPVVERVLGTARRVVLDLTYQVGHYRPAAPGIVLVEEVRVSLACRLREPWGRAQTVVTDFLQMSSRATRS
jgi:hypothetical protein